MRGKINYFSNQPSELILTYEFDRTYSLAVLRCVSEQQVPLLALQFAVLPGGQVVEAAGIADVGKGMLVAVPPVLAAFVEVALLVKKRLKM